MGKLSNAKITVLDEFENRSDDWDYGDFEKALKVAMGKRYGGYQKAKMVIVDADKDGQWPHVVEQYVRSYEALDNIPCELNAIARRLGIF